MLTHHESGPGKPVPFGVPKVSSASAWRPGRGAVVMKWMESMNSCTVSWYPMQATATDTSLSIVSKRSELSGTARTGSDCRGLRPLYALSPCEHFPCRTRRRDDSGLIQISKARQALLLTCPQQLRAAWLLHQWLLRRHPARH